MDLSASQSQTDKEGEQMKRERVI